MTMKPTRTLSALALAAVFAIAPLAAASAAPNNTDSSPRHHQNADHRGGHQGNHQHGDRWLRGLDLNQTQKDQIFKIRHDQEKAIYEQKKTLNTAAATLREASRTQPFDQVKAQQAAETLGRAKGQMALLQVQSMASIHAVLTPDQQKKLTDRYSKKMKLNPDQEP